MLVPLASDTCVHFITVLSIVTVLLSSVYLTSGWDALTPEQIAKIVTFGALFDHRRKA